MKLIGRSIGWGAVFGLLASFLVSVSLVIHWGGKSGGPGAPAGLYFLFVPIVSIEGALATGTLFGVSAVIAVLSRGLIRPAPIPYALLGLCLSLCIVVPFAAWIAGGYLNALRGAQGTYLLVPTVLLPILVIGGLVGMNVERPAKGQ